MAEKSSTTGSTTASRSARRVVEEVGGAGVANKCGASHPRKVVLLNFYEKRPIKMVAHPTSSPRELSMLFDLFSIKHFKALARAQQPCFGTSSSA